VLPDTINVVVTHFLQELCERLDMPIDITNEIVHDLSVIPVLYHLIELHPRKGDRLFGIAGVIIQAPFRHGDLAKFNVIFVNVEVGIHFRDFSLRKIEVDIVF
jgi:hypothetical protein